MNEVYNDKRADFIASYMKARERKIIAKCAFEYRYVPESTAR